MMNARRLTLALFAAAVLSMTGTAPLLAQATDWRKIQKPPLSEFKIQEPKRIVLPNGMVIFLQEDHELPLIGGTAVIRGGSREEPADKAGLADIFGQVWRTGGTKTRTGDQLDDYLEARAAKVETGADIDSTGVSFDVLKGDFDDVFKVFNEVLRQPEFREDKMALAKNQLNTSIARRNDDPLQIAGREATRLAYGPNSPYARRNEYYTVSSVNRDDLVAWHRKYVHPNNIILGIHGDFDGKKMEQKLRSAFGSWAKGPAAPKFQSEFVETKPGVYFIPKDDVNQSSIRMVHMGTTRDNPDYHALEVMNEVLGGGFSARLFSNIRSKKGLAYNVGGGVGTSWDHPGIFQLYMGTKSETTAAAIDALNEELDNLKKSPATDIELERAKDAILNSFIFRFDSKEEVLTERVLLEFYGYPADFTARYRTGIEKVTADDVARVARKYVNKDKVALLVVGKSADFDRQLSGFGAVQTIDIAIPETKPGAAKAAPAPSAGSGGGARALMQKVVDGMGGMDRVLKIKTVHQKAAANLKTPQGDMAMDVDSIDVFPDRSRQVMKTPMGEMTMVMSPSAAFMGTPMGIRDLPASQKEGMVKEMKRSPIYVVQHLEDGGYTFSEGGVEKVGDVETRVLIVTADGSDVKWFVDPASGKILRTSSTTMAMGSPAVQVVDFTEWKVIDGLPVAMKRTITRNGEPGGTVEVKEFEINGAVDETIFVKPEPKP